MTIYPKSNVQSFIINNQRLVEKCSRAGLFSHFYPLLISQPFTFILKKGFAITAEPPDQIIHILLSLFFSFSPPNLRLKSIQDVLAPLSLRSLAVRS